MTSLDERPAPPAAQPGEHRPASTPRRFPRPAVSWEGVRGRLRLQPGSVKHDIAAVAAGILTTILAWAVFYALVLTPLVQSRDQDVLYAQFREQLALATAPLGGVITPGAPVGVMSMPSAGVRDEVLVEGTSSQQLTTGPGHRRDTPLPGQSGVSVVYGRSALFGSPFGRIAEARRGDVITVVTGLGRSKYVVDDVRRPGDRFPAALAPGAGRLTLVTSSSGGWRSGWAAQGVVFVDASLASKPAGSVPGRPASVPKDETAMQGDTGALLPLVLWLPLLFLAAVGVVWAQARWGRWQAYIVGVPVVLGALWGVSQTAVQLLPNLF